LNIKGREKIKKKEKKKLLWPKLQHRFYDQNLDFGDFGQDLDIGDFGWHWLLWLEFGHWQLWVGSGYYGRN
jgi:hypothetical protein